MEHRARPDRRQQPSTRRVGGGPYDDHDVRDEFYCAPPFWAVGELALTTGLSGYVADVKASPYYRSLPTIPHDGFSWGSVAALGAAYDLSAAPRYRDALLGGLDHLFGRNAPNISYVTGYGSVSSQNQRTRMYAHELDPADDVR